jgi:hypothetical protein
MGSFTMPASKPIRPCCPGTTCCLFTPADGILPVGSRPVPF